MKARQDIQRRERLGTLALLHNGCDWTGTAAMALRHDTLQ